MKAGIVGESGYTGVELLRLLAAHPVFEVAVATAHSHAGEPVGSTPRPWPRPTPVSCTRTPTRPSSMVWTSCSAPCRTASRSGSSPALGRVGRIVDLAADFRLRDASLYPRWYGEEHASPALLSEAVYGLPELFREGLAGAALVAAAGCYPTAAGLALAPLVRSGLVEASGIVVDAALGVSGAGRGLKRIVAFRDGR